MLLMTELQFQRYILKKMIKKVEVELLTEITFNMEDLLKSMIQDAINRGYTTNEDIIDFIENEMFHSI